MKRLSLFMVGFMLFGAIGVHAELPHTFSAGTPAKASEVNANFQNLDTRIKSLEANSDGSGSGNGGGSGDGDVIYAHKFTYTYIASTPGQEITIGDQTYRIIRIPVKTPDGKMYALTFPSATSSSTLQVLVQHLQYSMVKEFEINGYPTEAVLPDSWGYTVGSNSFRVEYGVSATISINVGDCRISVFYNLSEQQVMQSIYPATYDYTGVDMTPVGDNLAMIEHIDKWLDYIFIEQLP